ncbi:hypothetical protein ACWDTT_13265 [Streptosporangium sandarakinum]
MASGTGPLSPDFSGIDPELMQGFVTALERGRDVIGEQSERIRQLLATAQVPAAGLQPIREIKGWIDDELPKLRERLRTINQDLPMLGVTSPLLGQAQLTAAGSSADPFSWGLLPYDEKTGKSPAGSAKRGTGLAAELIRLPPSSLGLPSDDYDRILGKLADGKKDPYLTAAFFRVIGAKGALGMIHRLYRYDKEAAEKHRKVIGDALGTAIGAQPRLLGKAWEASTLKKAPATELAPLLRYGTFPTAWLAGIARDKVGKPTETGDGSRPRRWKTDLVPLLPTLANNPAAARDLFNDMPRQDLRDLFTEINRMETPLPYKRPWGLDFEISTEFGRMLAAGGGAYETGPHSPEAAKFAFNVMIIMGDLKDTDGTQDIPGTPMEVTPGARPFMSLLAGAYAAEITEGANIGDANMTQPSALMSTRSAFGQMSAFTLSPKDTYRFLKTFADSPENLKPFDVGMGWFSRKVIGEASVRTRETGNVEHLDRVFTALGNVRGFERAAVEKVQGNLDMIDKQQDDLVGFIRDTAIGVTSIFAAPTLAADFTWLALSTTFAAKGAFGGDDETRVEKADKQDTIDTLGRQHTYAQILMANGFKPKVTPSDYQSECPPGVAIADGNGKLRPFEDLMKQGNRGLEAFEKWTIANGMGSEDESSLGQLSSRYADAFESRNKRGRERALAFDG